jgi:hypothetical protein
VSDLIDLILIFGGGLFVYFSGAIVGHIKRFKDRSDQEKRVLACVLILAVLGPLGLVYTLWKSGRLF